MVWRGWDAAHGLGGEEEERGAAVEGGDESLAQDEGRVAEEGGDESSIEAV